MFNAEQVQKRIDECAESMARAPRGPWSDEPHRQEFRHKGFACLMQRVPGLLHWCGYVGVPPGHPLHGVHYSDDRSHGVSVHGGLTFADACGEVACHRPEPDEPDQLWWFGFDCAHFGDAAPGRGGSLMREFLGDSPSPIGVYRDAAWVEAETRRLAEQLAELGWPVTP